MFQLDPWLRCKMVDRQKALLIVLLALLIYPNDIFGKYDRLTSLCVHERGNGLKKSPSISIDRAIAGLAAMVGAHRISEKQDQFDGNLERIPSDPAILKRSSKRRCPSWRSRALMLADFEWRRTGGWHDSRGTIRIALVSFTSATARYARPPVNTMAKLIRFWNETHACTLATCDDIGLMRPPPTPPSVEKDIAFSEYRCARLLALNKVRNSLNHWNYRVA